ncbi:MAG: acetyl-CoA hydrolase/transferase C-terminal domain-containing protein [Nocardioidaceae bacterium]
MVRPPSIAALLESKRSAPEAVLEHIPDGADLIVGVANGEPVAVMDAIENSGRLRDVRVHQMLPMRSRRYIEGEVPGLTGAAVTTFQNLVDCVVTEHGVAELRGSSIQERTRKLIRIAHPAFRDDLARQAREIGYL